jgi:hypothetical protein
VLTQDLIQSMKEDELSRKVIIPLLKGMGFQDVYYHHGGIIEQGKDIVCWKYDELTARKNYALVIKVVPITGQAKAGKGTAGEVATQIQQAFGAEFLDPVTAESQIVHECWVITSQKIMPGGEKSILSIIKATNLDRHVKFIDSEKLWALVEKYLAKQTPLGKLLEVQKMLDSIDTHYQPIIHFDGNEIKVSLKEKFSGAMKEKPLDFHVAFEFPDTPDGKLAKDALKSNYTTGSPASISSDFIQSVEFPDSLRKLLGELKIEKLEITPLPRERSLVVRLEIECDDGDTFALNRINLQLIQGGTEEITLESSERELPIKIRMVLNFHSKNAQVTFGWKFGHGTCSNIQLLQMYELQNCLSKSFTLRILSEDLGITVFSKKSSQSITSAPNKFFFDSLKVFARLQKKINKPVLIPIRELADDEIRSIAELIQIVQTGKVSGKWSELDIELLSFSPEGFAALNTEPSFLRLSGEHTMEIFDVEIPLGKADTLYRNAVLANFKEIQNIRAAGGGDIKLHFVAKDGTADVEVVYEEYFRES